MGAIMTNKLPRLRLAVQKSGRLSDDGFALLKQCGIKFRVSGSKLLCHCHNFPLDLLLVRDDDIPSLVMQGVCDLGIVGHNVLQEYRLTHRLSDYQCLRVLPFGSCVLKIAVLESFNYQTTASLSGFKIATSYPQLLRAYLTENNIDATVIELSGSVEIAPRLGLADAICDLVSTGATLEANGLKPVATVFESEARLIGRPGLKVEESVALQSLFNRMAGVLQAKESKYVMLHAPKTKLQQIVDLLPGAEHPTIVPLQGHEQHVAVHAVCYESVFWETMEQLKAAGASAILVLPIEKMMV